MLMEVNTGNAKMVEAFSEAGPKYPISNSLMYSIYKMLPNDTDLTVFRKQGKIQGFNFAFIDNHYNYHTAQDDFRHLSHQSVAHQGTYLMPLLSYFSNSDLTSLNSTHDEVYFNTPVNFMHYPFKWVFAMLAVAVVLFLFFAFIGVGKRILIPGEIGRGFLLFIGAVVVTGGLTWFLWKGLLTFYPQYNDIMQGFTYNGHSYIAAFVFLSLAIGFLFYMNSKSETVTMSYSVAPLFFWLIINLLIAIFLPGAGFFIIPVFFALLMFGWYVITQNASKVLNLILAIPAIIIFVPFIIMFPIGLGLKILYGSAMLTVLVFGLLMPVFGSFSGKGLWSALCFVTSIGFFMYAHWNSGYETGKAKPNSLLYVYDAEKNKALWATYDTNLDEWTKNYLTANPNDGKPLADFPLYSKYNSAFTYTHDAPLKSLPKPSVEFLMDSVVGEQRYVKIRVTPNRKVNRYDIFANEKMTIHNMKANGAKPLGQKGSQLERNGKKIISYYVVDNEPLEMQFSFNKTQFFDMHLMESSFDLLSNPMFQIIKRDGAMMPTPFVLNDAVVIKMRIVPTPKIKLPVVNLNSGIPEILRDTLTVPEFEN